MKNQSEYLPKRTGVKRSCNQELIAKGELPKPFLLSENRHAKGIFEDGLIEWQKRRSPGAKTPKRGHVR
jgi:predicted DNA-binding transcriptional regulator AlpA